MFPGNYSLVGGNCTNNGTAYTTNNTYQLPVAGANWVARLVTPIETFQIKIKRDSGNTLTNRRININRSTVGSVGVNLTNKVVHQINYDVANNAVVYDVQLGDINQCAKLGAMLPGQSLQSEYYLALDYETP